MSESKSAPYFVVRRRYYSMTGWEYWIGHEGVWALDDILKAQQFDSKDDAQAIADQFVDQDAPVLSAEVYEVMP
jgi:hypothetical protein